MKAVRREGTAPELLFVEQIRNCGFQFTLNDRTLPGKPDVVFPRSKVAVFCDGDFWHGRHWKQRKESGQFRVRRDYWIAKIERNIRRDRRVNRELRSQGWVVLRVWERDLYKSAPRIANKVLAQVRERSSK
jgi:DNA mismatch endonuclease Vsr